VARMDRVDPDRRIERCALEGGGLREEQHPGLGRAVCAVEWRADESRDRGDVDDRTAATGHRTDGVLDPEEDAVEVDGDDPSPFLQARLRQRQQLWRDA